MRCGKNPAGKIPLGIIADAGADFARRKLSCGFMNLLFCGWGIFSANVSQ
jgi:hypothetical protein